ncbi:MAG: acyl-CoA dehydrogenase family protein [Candidatus Nanopelagicales bacterium]
MPDAQGALRNRVREFLGRELAAGGFAPRCDSWLIGFDPAFSARLGAAGLIGLMLPTEYGGQGLTIRDRLVVSEELLAAGAPVAAHWFAERQFAPALLRLGTAEQRAEWIPRITRGELFMAVGLSESDAGSDLAAVRTKATPVQGGWSVSGTKLWSSGAHHAHVIVVLARTSGERHEGLTQLIVRLPDPSVVIRPILAMNGEHHFNEVVFTDTFVPHADVLGEPGRGWKQAMEELATERAGPERYLSTFPLLHQVAQGLLPGCESQAHIGELIAAISTFRVINMRVVEHIEANRTDAIDIAMLKDMGTVFEQRTIDVALDMINDHHRSQPVPKSALSLLRDAQYQAPGFTVRGGTNEVLRGIVSKGLLL